MGSVRGVELWQGLEGIQTYEEKHEDNGQEVQVVREIDDLTLKPR